MFFFFWSDDHQVLNLWCFQMGMLWLFGATQSGLKDEFYITVTTESGVVSDHSSFQFLFPPCPLVPHRSLHCRCHQLYSPAFFSAFFLTFYLLLSRVLRQSWTETQKVLSLARLTQRGETYDRDLWQKRYDSASTTDVTGHRDAMNLSCVYCVCLSITDRPGHTWETNLKTLKFDQLMSLMG